MLIRLLRALTKQRSPRPTASATVATASPPAPGMPVREAAGYAVRAREALARGDLHAARAALDEGARLAPGDVEIGLLLAMVQAQTGDLSRAEQLLRSLLREHPAEAAALHDALGNVLRLQGHAEAAIEQYDTAISMAPAMPSTHANRALCMHDLGRFEEARNGFRRALQIDPSDLTTSTNMAALEFDLGDEEVARTRIDGVLAADPDFAQAHWVRAFALLRRGDYERGWLDYEWREQDAGRVSPSPDLPVWQGERIDGGPLLVCAEQGLGDQIMFASCLPDLARDVAEVVVECDPRLVGLFARSYPGMRIYPHLKKALQPWLQDGVRPIAKTWLGSLPGRYRRSRSAFDRSGGPYLKVDAARAEAWRKRLEESGSGLKVGISWRGGTPTTRSAMRSIPLEQWLPLLRRPDIRFIDLQYGHHADEVESLRRMHGVSLSRWPEALEGDYDETAALVSVLDLVVSVQTSIVHLAGAIGKEAWVLVPRAAEWRYGAGTQRMDWYPTARIFRQTAPDWSAVLTAAATELDGLRAYLRHSAGTYL